jgi:hypothetical protein
MDKKFINHNGKLARKSGLGKKLFDHQGSLLRKGDTVKLLTLPLEMFLELTEPEQKTLRAGIGKKHLIQGPSSQGKIKLEFYDAHGALHAILINPSCVTRILG